MMRTYCLGHLKINLYGLVLLAFFKVNAQNDLDDYLQKYPTEPVATEFEIYGNYSPPNSFGTIPINIPLCQISVKEFTIPVTLGYNSAAGIKVRQKSTEVGLGWSLNINNFYIEQIVNGVLDWHNHNADTKFNEIESSRASSDTNDVNELYHQLRNYLVGRHLSNTDYEQDEYNYSFNGSSGNFLFDENGELVNLSTSEHDLKIAKTANGFTIIDESGYQYLFDISLDYEIDSSNGDLTIQSKIFKRRWYLHKILLPTNEEIEFVYTDGSNETGSIINETKTKYTYRSIYHISESSAFSILRPIPGNQPSSSSITYNKLNLLKSIIYPNGKLELNYISNSYNKLMLSKLDLFSGNEIIGLSKIKSIKLGNQNFYKGQDTGSPNLVDIAPKLEEVSYHDSNGLEINKYQFFYEGGLIPRRTSKKKDYWGYYGGPAADAIPEFTYYNKANGQTYTFEGGDRKPKFSYTKIGVLNKIVYPTGGYSEFIFEPNYYFIEKRTSGSNTEGRNIALTAVGANPLIGEAKAEDSATFELSFGQVNSPGGVTVTYSASQYQLESVLDPLPYIQFTSPNVFDNRTVVFNNPGQRISNTFQIMNLPAGQYTAKAFVGNAIANPNDPQPHILGTAAVELALSWSQYVGSGPSVPERILMTGGGLRLKEMKSYENTADATPILIKKYDYGSKVVENQEVGDFMGIHTQGNLIGATNGITDENHLIAHFFTQKEYDFKLGEQNSGGIAGAGCVFNKTYLSTSLQLSSEPQFPLEYHGASVYYDKVIVSSVDGNGQSQGKSEYFFSFPKQKKIMNLDGNFSRSVQAERDLAGYSPYSKVNLIKEIHYDTSNDTVQAKTYKYDLYNLKSLRKLKLAFSDFTSSISGCYVANPNLERSRIEDNIRYYRYNESFELEKLTAVIEKNYFVDKKISSSISRSYI